MLEILECVILSFESGSSEELVVVCLEYVVEKSFQFFYYEGIIYINF